MRISTTLLLGLALGWPTVARAEKASDKPRPIPLTRPEMKQLLDDMKVRTPRIPLPEMTEEEKKELGERGGGYEGRLRIYFAPSDEGRGGFGGGGGGRPDVGRGGEGRGGPGAGGGQFGRSSDPKMTLDYAFKTELFWIVSRTNNCQYCLGHQESKLLNAGLSEDQIAALDGDWSENTPAEQAAFALARKVTHQPHLLNDADIESVRKHYTDLQILEMILSVAGNNSINRWKEGVGVPQSEGGGGGFGRRSGDAAAAPAQPEQPAKPHSYVTPTSDKFQKNITKVAVLTIDDKTGKPTSETVCKRPALESQGEVEQALETCRNRKPRLPLVEEAEARKVVGEDFAQGPLPQWVRLLANFPQDGKNQILSLKSADEKGDLKPLIKAQVSWIIARQDRAWYATGVAKDRLKKLGLSDADIYRLDGSWADYEPAERALFTVARKLAASPVVLTDEDVANAVKLAGPRDVVQMVRYTTSRALFDRVTEAAGLGLEN